MVIFQHTDCLNNMSPPSRGAWIEMLLLAVVLLQSFTSPPSRGAWIEITVYKLSSSIPMSPPSRGAWIEILLDNGISHFRVVAPLAGGVD